MIVILIPLAAAILGLLMWALASNAIVKESGKILFAAGVLVTLLVIGTGKLHIP